MNFIKGLLRADIDPEWLLRIFTVIPVVLILLAGGGAIWIYFFVLSLLPQGQSVVETPGLSADVRVVRDGNGIPGIIGNTEEDLALVLGYVMAQDRLWQMDYLRRAGQGRLAEILGPDYLEGDHLIRTVSVGVPKTYNPKDMDARERRWLEHFVQGINTYIATHAKKPPVEFSLLEYRPRLFTPDDVMSIILALAWESSVAARVDPTLTQILGRLGKDRALELFPSDPAAAEPLVVSDLVGWMPTGGLFASLNSRQRCIRFPGLRGGCAWTVGRNRTRSEKPMVACSAYQVLTAPGFWYRARLAAGDFHLSGVFIPGVPVALGGSNGRVSWGSVSTSVDDADLYVERLDPDDAGTFWKVDRSRTIRTVNERYRVRGRSSVSRAIHITHTGPIVSDVHKARALSLRWTAREGLGLFEAFFALNRGVSGDGVKSALKRLKAPCLNVVWADEEGSFGIQTAGLIPIRPSGSDGIVPMPAWTGVHDWVGFIPFDDLPSVTDPVKGSAVLADGRPGGLEYPFLVSCYWNDDAKRLRIEKLLERTGEHYKESFQAIQTDSVSPLAQRLTPVILKALEGQTGIRRTEQDAMQVLGSWNYDMGRDSSGAAVFGLMYHALAEDLLSAPLGEDLYAVFGRYYALPSKLVTKIFVQNSRGWIGDADPRSVLAKSFRKAVSLGVSLMGEDPAKWKWGEIHTTLFRHPLTARSRFLEALYHVGPVPFEGSVDTIDFAGWSLSAPFGVREGVSLREIADMTDPPQIFAISPMGSSAHFFSSHYKDQTGPWSRGRSFKDPVQRSQIQESGLSTVVFKPGRPGAVSMK